MGQHSAQSPTTVVYCENENCIQCKTPVTTDRSPTTCVICGTVMVVKPKTRSTTTF